MRRAARVAAPARHPGAQDGGSADARAAARAGTLARNGIC
jgi:hypothetical protein